MTNVRNAKLAALAEDEKTAAKNGDKAKVAQDEAEAKNWETGGKYDLAAKAAIGVLSGSPTGAGMLVAGASPYVSHAIGEATQGNTAGDKAANILLHAAWGAVSGQAETGNALAGALGEGGSAAAAQAIQSQMYPGIPKDQLTEQQKQNISTVVQAVTGALGAAAGALGGGDAVDVLASAGQAQTSGKNEVENNWLSPKEWQQLDRDNAACAKGNQAACQDADRLNQKSYERDVDLRVNCGVDGTSGGCQKESTKAIAADNTLATNNAGDVIAYNPKHQKLSDFNVDVVTDGSVSPQVKGSFEYKAAGSLDSSVANGTKLFVIDPLVSVGVGGAELSDGEYANGAIDLVSGVLGVTLIGKGVGLGVDAGKAALEGADAGINFANDAGKAAGVLDETGNAANDAANIAKYPALKQQLRNENLMNIASQDPRLAAAAKGSGNPKNPNFSIGTGTAEEADNLGKIWVGDGATPMKGYPGGWVSADGTRIYRPPRGKPNTPKEYNPTGTQANFELWSNGKRISNGHLIIQ
jgi:filamentous hemagglutinin